LAQISRLIFQNRGGGIVGKQLEAIVNLILEDRGYFALQLVGGHIARIGGGTRSGQKIIAQIAVVLEIAGGLHHPLECQRATGNGGQQQGQNTHRHPVRDP